MTDSPYKPSSGFPYHLSLDICANCGGVFGNHFGTSTKGYYCDHKNPEIPFVLKPSEPVATTLVTPEQALEWSYVPRANDPSFPGHCKLCDESLTAGYFKSDSCHLDKLINDEHCGIVCISCASKYILGYALKNAKFIEQHGCTGLTPYKYACDSQIAGKLPHAYFWEPIGQVKLGHAKITHHLCPSCALKNYQTSAPNKPTEPSGPKAPTITYMEPPAGPDNVCSTCKAPAYIFLAWSDYFTGSKTPAYVCAEHLAPLLPEYEFNVNGLPDKLGAGTKWFCTQGHGISAQATWRKDGSGNSEGWCNDHFLPYIIASWKKPAAPPYVPSIAWAPSGPLTPPTGKLARTSAQGMPLGHQYTGGKYYSSSPSASGASDLGVALEALKTIPDAKVKLEVCKSVDATKLASYGLPDSKYDLSRESADFYILGEMARVNDEWIEPWRAKAKEMAEIFATYIEMACLGELRYWPHRTTNTARRQKLLASEYGPIFKVIAAGDPSRYTVWFNYQTLAKEYGPKWLLQGIVLGHGSLKWPGGGFGGGKWANCARTTLAYRRGKLTPVMFVDTALGLAHNGDIVYNKLWNVSGLKVILDLARKGDVPKLAKFASPELVAQMKAVHSEAAKRLRKTKKVGSAGGVDADG